MNSEKRDGLGKTGPIPGRSEAVVSFCFADEGKAQFPGGVEVLLSTGESLYLMLGPRWQRLTRSCMTCAVEFPTASTVLNCARCDPEANEEVALLGTEGMEDLLIPSFGVLTGTLLASEVLGDLNFFHGLMWKVFHEAFQKSRRFELNSHKLSRAELGLRHAYLRGPDSTS